MGRPPESRQTETAPAASTKLFLLSPDEAKSLTLGSLAFAFVMMFPIFFYGENPGAPLHTWLMTRPLLRFNGGVPGDLDRDVFMELRWVPYYTLTHFHQFPFWNPYKCGGMTMIRNPEGAVATPFILPYLIFGMASGVMVESICISRSCLPVATSLAVNSAFVQSHA